MKRFENMNNLHVSYNDSKYRTYVKNFFKTKFNIELIDTPDALFLMPDGSYQTFINGKYNFDLIPSKPMKDLTFVEVETVRLKNGLFNPVIQNFNVLASKYWKYCQCKSRPGKIVYVVLKNSRNANPNFNNTGKTNTLVKEMKLNEVEEKEEELYESEFKEDLKDEVKKIEEEENYENEFENEDINKIKQLEEQEDKEKNEVNLDDYKEIHESQKIQTQLNFFEDSILDNININKSRGHIVGNSFKKENENNEEGNGEENKNVLMSSELKDSYGDKILQNLNKYRRMALGESSLS